MEIQIYTVMQKNSDGVCRPVASHLQKAQALAHLDRCVDWVEYFPTFEEQILEANLAMDFAATMFDPYWDGEEEVEYEMKHHSLLGEGASNALGSVTVDEAKKSLLSGEWTDAKTS